MGISAHLHLFSFEVAGRGQALGPVHKWAFGIQWHIYCRDSHSFSQYLTMPTMCHRASQCGYHDKESLGRKRVSCGEGVNNCFGSGLAFLVQPRSERWWGLPPWRVSNRDSGARRGRWTEIFQESRLHVQSPWGRSWVKGSAAGGESGWEVMAGKPSKKPGGAGKGFLGEWHL